MRQRCLRLTNQSSLVVINLSATINATIGSYAALVIGGPLDKRLAGTSAASGSCRQPLANHVPPLSALRPFPSPNLDPCSLPAAQTPSRSALQGIRLVKSHHPPQQSNRFRQHGCQCHRGPCVNTDQMTSPLGTLQRVHVLSTTDYPTAKRRLFTSCRRSRCIDRCRNLTNIC